MTEWEKTPFKTLEEAKAFALNADLLIEPLGAPPGRGLLGFKVIDDKTETLIAQHPGGPIISFTLLRPKREAPPWKDRTLTLGEDPPWQWSPALSSLAAVERLFNQEPVLKGDYIAYRSGDWIHEYLITLKDQVYQRLIHYKEETSG